MAEIQSVFLQIYRFWFPWLTNQKLEDLLGNLANKAMYANSEKEAET